MQAQKRLLLLAMVLLLLTIGTIPTFPSSAQGASSTAVIPSIINATQVLNITAAPKYSLFSLNAIADVSSSFVLAFSSQVNGSTLNTNLTSPVEIDLRTSFEPSQITALAFVNNSIAALTVQLIPAQATALRGYYVILPSGTASSTILIQGTQTGEYLLGQYVLNVPFLTVSSPQILALNVNSQTNLFLPKSSKISQAYGFGSSAQAGPVEPIPSSTTSGAPPGQVRYEIPSPVGIVIMQSVLFVPLSVLLTALALILIAFAALGFFSRGRLFISDSIERVRFWLIRASDRLPRLTHIRLRRLRFDWRSVLRAKNMLVLFIICGLLMISFAVLTGPSPTVNVYAISPNQEALQIQTSLQASSAAKVQVVTPSQDFTDFNVMSSVGMFKVLVVSDYPAPALAEVSKFVIPNINNVPVIVLTPTADPAFVSEIKSIYRGQIVNMSDAGGLRQAFSGVATSNALGLQISNSNFKLVLIIEGGLSFLLVLFGWAYLGAKAAEPTTEKSLINISSVILSGVFVFYFSELLYVITSATLNFPLSLHAVVSGAETITAVGLLGAAIHVPFGGGSTPRLLMGIIGILIGGFGAQHGKMFSNRALGLIIGVSVLLVVNPLQLGKVTFQGLLLFVGNTPIGVAFSDSLTIKGFLYGIGTALGGTVSPVYLMSAGKILYFAGLVPLAFIRKMGRGTATFTFLLCAIIVGDGGVRVGEMTPDKTVVAVLPGLIAGVIIALVLLLVAWVEIYLTTAYVRSRP